MIGSYPKKDEKAESEGEQDMESERVALANECRLSIADVWNCEIRHLAMSESLNCTECMTH